MAKTGRLVVADPAHEMGSVASEVAAIVAEEGFWDLQAPISRVTTPHTHIPYKRRTPNDPSTRAPSESPPLPANLMA